MVASLDQIKANMRRRAFIAFRTPNSKKSTTFDNLTELNMPCLFSSTWLWFYDRDMPRRGVAFIIVTFVFCCTILRRFIRGFWLENTLIGNFFLSIQTKSLSISILLQELSSNSCVFNLASRRVTLKQGGEQLQVEIIVMQLPCSNLRNMMLPGESDALFLA